MARSVASPTWRAGSVLAEAAGLARGLRPFAGVLVMGGLLAAAAYWAAVAWLVDAWLHDPFYGHGFLVLPLAAAMAWRVRDRVRQAPRRRSVAAEAGLGLAALATYAAGWSLREPALLVLSLLLFGLALGAVVLGAPRLARLWMPAAFLLLAIPPPFLARALLPLQEMTSRGALAFLSVTGLPTVLDGTVLLAGGYRFEVVPLCTGLAGLLSLVTLTCALLAFRPLPVARGALLVAFAVLAAVLVNLLRVAATVWSGARWGEEVATGLFHAASDLALLLVGLALVVALRALLARREVARVA